MNPIYFPLSYDLNKYSKGGCTAFEVEHMSCKYYHEHIGI